MNPIRLGYGAWTGKTLLAYQDSINQWWHETLISLRACLCVIEYIGIQWDHWRTEKLCHINVRTFSAATMNPLDLHKHARNRDLLHSNLSKRLEVRIEMYCCSIRNILQQLKSEDIQQNLQHLKPAIYFTEPGLDQQQPKPNKTNITIWIIRGPTETPINKTLIDGKPLED